MAREPLPENFWDSPEEKARAEQKQEVPPSGAGNQLVNILPDKIHQGIARMESEFAKVLPAHITAAQYARLSLIHI